MARTKKPAARKTAARKPAARKPAKRKTVKKFRFQLGLPGVAGIAVVVFCLFLWMFLLGLWAGQTILLPAPTADQAKASRKVPSGNSPVQILKPDGKKSPVTPQSGMVRLQTDALLSSAAEISKINPLSA